MRRISGSPDCHCDFSRAAQSPSRGAQNIVSMRFTWKPDRSFCAALEKLCERLWKRRLGSLVGVPIRCRPGFPNVFFPHQRYSALPDGAIYLLLLSLIFFFSPQSPVCPILGSRLSAPPTKWKPVNEKLHFAPQHKELTVIKMTVPDYCCSCA